jgi:hypothetical protein
MQANGIDYSLIFNASHNREYYIWYTESMDTPIIWTQHRDFPFSGTGH